MNLHININYDKSEMKCLIENVPVGCKTNRFPYFNKNTNYYRFN
jgi:hypothetical protein